MNSADDILYSPISPDGAKSGNTSGASKGLPTKPFGTTLTEEEAKQVSEYFAPCGNAERLQGRGGCYWTISRKCETAGRCIWGKETP